MSALQRLPGSVAHGEKDLANPEAPAILFGQVKDRFGHVDVLVVNHARSSRQSLAEVTAEELDTSWAVNARATVLLV
jgi:3-oxoacyl-[acyl-carrier protein] reductase